ncbi:MAG: hypothetical protein PHW82_08345 [Bacteroidales bacterium]|nr:hypothetical protein [Bacteroidales bacterium]
MRTLKSFGIPVLFFIYLIIAAPFQSCEQDDNDGECDTCMVVYKPNIYIYPKEQIQLSVIIDFPMGGKIIASIPDYGTGWNVIVDTTGLIDNTYSYLFYESTQPDIWQKKYGWIIKTEDLVPFFRENMAQYGFNGKEIDDFVEYWIPRLDDFAFYSILPQTKALIEGVISLQFSMQPDNLLRLFYVVEGYNQLPEDLSEPNIESFDRDGYFITEWGVILK